MERFAGMLLRETSWTDGIYVAAVYPESEFQRVVVPKEDPKEDLKERIVGQANKRKLLEQKVSKALKEIPKIPDISASYENYLQAVKKRKISS